MVKRLLVGLLLLCSAVASGQLLQQDYTYGRKYYRFATDSCFAPPADTFRVPGNYPGLPWMAVKSGVIYVWDGGKWVAASGGSGVTSIATGYGINGGTITSTGTLTADTTVGAGLISWPRWGKLRDSLSVVIGSGGGGTVDLSLLNSKLDTANTYRWEHLSDSVSIHARDGAEINYIPFKDSILLTGGWHRDSIPASTKQVYMLSKDMQHFRRLADAPWTNGLHCYGSHYNGGDTLFVWGGDAESPNVQEFWSFKISTETWTLINGAIVAAPRFNYADAWIDGEAYMIGGNNQYSTDSTDAVTDIVKGKPDGSSWTTVQTGLTKFGGIYSGSGYYFNGHLYVIAGVGYTYDESTRDYKVSVWRSDDKGVTWQRRADVPFHDEGVFGKGKGFIKLKPNWDGTRLGLFFGYQREPSVGIHDFGECLWMDTTEKWHSMGSLPKVAKGDKITMNNRHATAVTAMPDGSWIIATGFLWNDAWRVYPMEGTVKTQADYYNGDMVIGTRDNYDVQIRRNDTTRIKIQKDSINFVTPRIIVRDDEQPDPDAYRTAIRLYTPSVGNQIMLQTQSDSIKLGFSNNASVSGSFFVRGPSIQSLNLFKSGKMKVSYAGDNSDNGGGRFTFRSPSSSDDVLSIENASSVPIFKVNGGGYLEWNNSLGKTYFTYDGTSPIIAPVNLGFGIKVNGAVRQRWDYSTGLVQFPTTTYVPNGRPQDKWAVIDTTTGSLYWTNKPAADIVLQSSTYTPTLTNTTNVAASTAYVTGYMRVGNAITVYGKVTAQATGTGAVELRMSLPFPPGFGGDNEAGGVATCSATGETAGISSVSGTGTVAFKYSATTTSSNTFNFSFTYTYTAP